MDFNDYDDIDKIYEEMTMSVMPDILRHQLHLCGYTNALTVLHSPDNWIDIIENFLKKSLSGKPEDVIQKYGGELCTNAEEFGILPGHITLLNHLKVTITKSSKRKNKSDSNTPKKKLSLCSTDEKASSCSKTATLECQERKIKNQIITFLKSKSFSSIPDLSITQCINKKGNPTFAGTVSCVVCDKKISVHFDVYNRTNNRWVISNYTHHINEHLSDTKSNKCRRNVIQKPIDVFFKNSVPQDHVYFKDASSPLTETSEETSSITNNIIIDGEIFDPEFMEQNIEHKKDNRYGKYSRDYRCKIKLANAAEDKNQQLITAFFDKLIHFVGNDKNCVNNFLIFEKNVYNNSNVTSDSRENKTSALLKKLLELSTKVNKNRGDRFDTTIKKLCVYLFIIGGRRTYEILHANLPLPSLSTISRCLSTTRTRINEGEIRITELHEYLDKRQLGRVVWLSEDATRIVDRIEYDRVTNTLVGLVLPLKNGVPVGDYFKATNAKAIENHILSSNTSKLAYTIMVQPLEVKTPPFCIAIFGTDNQFTADDVIDRWKFIQKACEDKGITVLGVSGDGDSRILKAMEICSELGNPNEVFDEELGKMFCMSPENKTEMFYTQDTTHIGNKLRNRLFKKQKTLTLGEHEVLMEHLFKLTEIVNKDQHFIREKDLDGTDRMNYESVQRISNEKVEKLLENFVPKSEGTRIYLRCIRYCTEAFLNKDLSPLQRLEKIWFVVFLFRMWRHWILNMHGYTLGNNFVTRNSYIGIELNAHALTLLILCKQSHAKFLPELFSSQPCEGFFRTLRSMTSTLSTVVNFSMLEILYRIGRIDLQENLNNELPDDGITLPRLKEREHCSVARWPDVSKDEVVQTLLQAENAALLVALECGLSVDGCFQTLFDCKIGPFVNNSDHLDSETVDETEDNEDNESSSGLLDLEEFTGEAEGENEYEENDMEDVKKLESLKEIHLTNFSDKNCEDELSPFVTVQVGNKAPLTVKKSSLVWLLRKQSKRVSSDRLLRFRN